MVQEAELQQLISLSPPKILKDWFFRGESSSVLIDSKKSFLHFIYYAFDHIHMLICT